MYYKNNNYKRLERIRELIAVFSFLMIITAMMLNVVVITIDFITNKTILFSRNMVFTNSIVVTINGLLVITDLTLKFKIREYFYKKVNKS